MKSLTDQKIREIARELHCDRHTRTEERFYPSCCTSAYCGRIDCEGCDNKPINDEFKAWVARTGAEPVDPIWCPLIYRVKTGEQCI